MVTKVRVNKDHTKVYMGPSETHKVVGEAHMNDEFIIVEERAGWGLLKSRAGWIFLKSCDRISR